MYLIDIQDDNWKKLSKNEQDCIYNEYQTLIKINNDDPSNPLKSSIHLIEQTYGKHNIISPERMYDHICHQLFLSGAYQEDNGQIDFYKDVNATYCLNFTTKRQCEKIIALNKILNLVKYFNGDWKVDWSSDTAKWIIYLESYMDDEPKVKINYTVHDIYHLQSIFFLKSREDAEKIVEILGEDTIKLALTTDY